MGPIEAYRDIIRCKPSLEEVEQAARSLAVYTCCTKDMTKSAYLMKGLTPSDICPECKGDGLVTHTQMVQRSVGDIKIPCRACQATGLSPAIMEHWGKLIWSCIRYAAQVTP